MRHASMLTRIPLSLCLTFMASTLLLLAAVLQYLVTQFLRLANKLLKARAQISGRQNIWFLPFAIYQIREIIGEALPMLVS